MNNNRSIIILAAVVLLICGGAIYFLQMKPVMPPVSPTVTETPAEPAPAPTTTAPTTSTAPKAEPKTQPTAPPPKPAQLAEWETKIDTALRANLNETETAQLLINMLPSLPADGQAEAAQHISNLILDKDYGRVLPLVKNPNLPEPVLDVFVTDLMNRDDSVKLPALLEIAKQPNHPHHEEAATDLQIFLDGDFGNDWNKWDAAMKAYLKKQAAENAPDPVVK